MFFNLLTATNDFPCGNGWIYSAMSGKCYKFIATKKAWSTADNACKNEPGAYPGRSSLAKTDTYYDMISVTRAARYNREVQWVGGRNDAGKTMCFVGLKRLKGTGHFHGSCVWAREGCF